MPGDGLDRATREMGKYEDYSMLAASGEAVAGVCHSRGPNANLPPCG